MINSKSSFKCSNCSREYRSKYNYDRHSVGCDFFSKSLKEHNDDIETEEIIPSIPNMYRLIQELAVRINHLERENVKLKQHLNRKTHILDWLNNDSTVKPPIYFEDWFQNCIIPQIPNVLEVVFNSNLINGINTLFNMEFDNKERNTLPIRAFYQYNSVLFIYQKIISTDNNSKENENGHWVKMTSNDLIPWFHTLCKQFIIDFNTHWCCKYKDKLDNDETYKDLYINYYFKILGNNTDNTVIYNKIRLNIFHKIKENITLVM